jgi:predicted DNA-binding transcriptional regulator AlpA
MSNEPSQPSAPGSRKPDPEVLHPRDVAKRLRVSDRTLAGWRQKKKGPRYIKLAGGPVRYLRSDVDDWLYNLRGGMLS